MREIRTSGSEGGGAKPIVSPYPYTGAAPASSAERAGGMPHSSATVRATSSSPCFSSSKPGTSTIYTGAAPETGCASLSPYLSTHAIRGSTIRPRSSSER